jgi:uncharacterized membrane protein (UPF0127 family)
MIALAALVSCGKPPEDGTRPAPSAERPGGQNDQNDQNEKTPTGTEPTVVFQSGNPPVRVLVEVARKPRELQRGLMYREHLPPERGMLFLFDEERVQSFWMKNTLIPLDMIFVASDMTVAGVVENAEPQTTTPRQVQKASQYVVEVNAGWAHQHRVAAGTKVRFENVARD